MKFYTSAIQRGNNIYLRGYDNGRRINRKIQYEPYLFVPSKKESEYHTLDGTPVEKITFENISEGKDFLKKYSDVSNFEIYGLDKFVYAFINDYYPGEIIYEKEKINIGTLDIEVDSEGGFPDIKLANREVTAITLKCGNRIHVFGCGEFTHNDERIMYFRCKNEEELLLKFLKSWEAFDLDVITGWNIEFFDIPYLVNRIRLVLGEEFAKLLSPWRILNEHNIEIFGREQQSYTPMGIVTLDYQQLYKKFTYSQQESYRLDHICFVEIGEKKLDYSEYDNLFDLYKRDFQDRKSVV